MSRNYSEDKLIEQPYMDIFQELSWETADVFNTTYDTTKFAWERKNHDMGEREMCRVGLDVFLVMNNRKLTPEEEKIATKYLKEEVSVSAIKKHNHLQKKYKERYKLKPVKRTVADESFDENSE